MTPGWTETGYEPPAYPQPGASSAGPGPAQQYPSSRGGQWDQDTQPDWAQQAGYPEPQDYPGYERQQQWVEPTAAAQPPPAAAAAEPGLPTEFDHLFRDSTPDSRRAIDRQKPAVGGSGLGHYNGARPEGAPQQYAPEVATHERNAVPQGSPYPPFQQPFQPGPQQQEGQQFPVGNYQAQPFQVGQGAPADGWQQPVSGDGGGPTGNRRVLVVGGVALAVVAVIGIVIAMTGGSPGKPAASPSSSLTPSASAATTSPKQQADMVYQLIQQSEQLRADASSGVVEVNACKKLSDAQSLLASTAQKRQNQADSVVKLDVSGINNGAELVAQLKAAWSASAQFDSAYAQIAGDMQGGCTTGAVKKDANYQAANHAVSAANGAKDQAALLWNKVAASLNESQVASDKL
jgi:hypothetical protein